MKLKKRLLFCFFPMLILLIGACDQEQTAENTSDNELPSELVISSGPSGGNFYAMGASFSDLLTRDGVEVSPVPGGGTQNIVAVGDELADLGFTAMPSLVSAIKGEGEFEREYSELSVLTRLDSNPAYFIVPDDSPIQTIEDIIGHSVAGPNPGSSAEMVINDILEMAGIDKDEDIDMRPGSMSEGASLFKDRVVDVYAISTGLNNASISDIATSLDVRFISLSDEIIEKVLSKNEGYQELVLPSGNYRNQTEDLITISSDAVLIANLNMPEEHAHWITKTIVENFDTLQKANAWLEEVETEEMGDVSDLPMHPGAVEYFKGN